MTLGMLAPTEVSGQSNLKVKTYSDSGPTYFVDYSVLDAVFGTVSEGGITRNIDFGFTSSYFDLPTTVAGFGDAQCVIVQCIGGLISKSQADVLVAFVKNGGILLASTEALQIGYTTSNTVVIEDQFLEYVGEKLFCNTVTLTSTATQNILGTVTPFHPGNGALLLNSGGSTSVATTTTASCISGVPSASSILLAQSAATTPCGSTKVLDFIVPSYPSGCSTCGVNGFAILSGEGVGPMVGYTAGGLGAGLGTRNNTLINTRYAELMYDFLYNPTAMATRRAWSTIASNTSTICAPQKAVPDFTPTVQVDGSHFYSTPIQTSRDFVIDLSEIKNAPSCGQVVVKITKLSAFDITFPPTMTNANVNGGTLVNNSIWTKTENAMFITLTLNVGQILSPYSVTFIGGVVTAKAGAQGQTNQPLTPTIVNGSGADSVNGNNTYNVVISIHGYGM